MPLLAGFFQTRGWIVSRQVSVIRFSDYRGNHAPFWNITDCGLFSLEGHPASSLAPGLFVIKDEERLCSSVGYLS